MAETEKKLKEEDNRRIKRKYEELRAEWANCPESIVSMLDFYLGTVSPYPDEINVKRIFAIGVKKCN
ncbi:MAG: hypothetical protein GY795_42050 [Desulfobacterales bacterium]|nr:hypothetical protein [Desulfobacterales bacterium]